MTGREWYGVDGGGKFAPRCRRNASGQVLGSNETVWWWIKNRDRLQRCAIRHAARPAMREALADLDTCEAMEGPR